MYSKRIQKSEAESQIYLICHCCLEKRCIISEVGGDVQEVGLT